MIPHDMILNSVTQKKDKVEMLYYTIEVEQTEEHDDELPRFGKPSDQLCTSKTSDLKKNSKQGFEFFSSNFADKFTLKLGKAGQSLSIKIYARLIPQEENAEESPSEKLLVSL